MVADVLLVLDSLRLWRHLEFDAVGRWRHLIRWDYRYAALGLLHDLFEELVYADEHEEEVRQTGQGMGNSL